MKNRKAYKLTVGGVMSGVVCTTVAAACVAGIIDEVVAVNTAKFSEIDVIMGDKPKPQYYHSEAGFHSTNYYLSFQNESGKNQTLKISDGLLSLNESGARKIYNSAVPGNRYQAKLKNH